MLTIGICDDDKEICRELTQMICEYCDSKKIEPDIRSWYKGEELCLFLDSGRFLDILFLDIELVTTDGIQVGSYIRNELDDVQTSIVFISAKSEYALNLFKLSPLDFLIKPLKREDIAGVLNRKLTLLERNKQVFEYRERGMIYRLPVKDILYFCSDNKLVIAVTQKERREFHGRLKNLKKELPHNFLMIHQSFMVNWDYVAKYTYESVTLKNGTVLSISQTYRKTVRECLLKKQWEE